MSTDTTAPDNLDAALADAEKADTPDTPKATGKDAGKDAAPRKRKPSPTSGRKSGRKSLQTELRSLFEQLGGALMLLDPFDGIVVVDKADHLARSLDRIARDNESVHRALSALVASGGWGGAVMAFGSVALPIAMHHGLVPRHPLLDAAFIPEAAREHEQAAGEAPSPGGSLLDLLGGLSGAGGDAPTSGEPAGPGSPIDVTQLDGDRIAAAMRGEAPPEPATNTADRVGR